MFFFFSLGGGGGGGRGERERVIIQIVQVMLLYRSCSDKLFIRVEPADITAEAGNGHWGCGLAEFNDNVSSPTCNGQAFTASQHLLGSLLLFANTDRPTSQQDQCLNQCDSPRHRVHYSPAI